MATSFDDIRPFYDSEVSETIESLINDPQFRVALEKFIHPLTWEQFVRIISQCRTVEDFQTKVIRPFMQPVIDATTSSLSEVNPENYLDNTGYTVISNHRDIVLDAGFLNILLSKRGLNTTEIAIGDNLLVYPWITKLVKLNKSFIVRRGVGVREMLLASKHLSEYIKYRVDECNQSIWIAQREGRAKDSNDKTQTSLIKMLTLSNDKKPLETIQHLNILPMTISYEYDPCDYLKAKEMQLKRDLADYKKTQQDDLLNMATGIKGFKGNVCFRYGKTLNSMLTNMEEPQNSNERNILLERVAKMIDEQIHLNYVFFANNYVAYDLITNTTEMALHYSEEEKNKFEAYLNQQVNKIDIPNKDTVFLRSKIIEMYANPLKNHLIAKG